MWLSLLTKPSHLSCSTFTSSQFNTFHQKLETIISYWVVTNSKIAHYIFIAMWKYTPIKFILNDLSKFEFTWLFDPFFGQIKIKSSVMITCCLWRYVLVEAIYSTVCSFLIVTMKICFYVTILTCFDSVCVTFLLFLTFTPYYSSLYSLTPYYSSLCSCSLYPQPSHLPISFHTTHIPTPS